MMRVYQVKCGHPDKLEAALLSTLKIKKSQLISYKIHRRSIDARKGKVSYSYIVDVQTSVPLKEGVNVRFTPDESYHFPTAGAKVLASSPLVVGYGPAGLFAGLILAQAGYRPVILERGAAVDKRKKAVESFWAGGPLDPENNVQFGEGGAGTFSDGKLTTRSKDSRARKVLEELVAHGADADILIDQHPHIGTDAFVKILKRLRHTIESFGGRILFSTKLEDIEVKDGKLVACYYGKAWHEHSQMILATGHSARDIYELMKQKGVHVKAKNFAVGVRIEHEQSFINQAMLHEQAHNPDLIPARYQVTFRSSLNTGVYSFCMCPGGYVINAASHPGQMVVNGMSYAARDGKLANAALLVQVDENDFGQDSLAFQEALEKRCFQLTGGYYGACQLASDYLQGKKTEKFLFLPTVAYRSVDLNQLFSKRVNQALHEALTHFEAKIPGFVSSGAILTGVESRSSSAVVIERDETYQTNIAGIYPCGEGAGFAGGIMTSAIDGIRLAEAIIKQFQRRT